MSVLITACYTWSPTSALMVLRLLLILSACPALLVGQFQNLVTTDDGSLLLFSSALQLQGTSEYSWAKLFSIDSTGLNLYAQRQEEGPAPGSRLSNFYLMKDADLSGDGSVKALITGRVCIILGSGCFIGNYFTQSEVSGVPGLASPTIPGWIRISRNGRYGFACCEPATPQLIDLETGATMKVSTAVSTPTHGMVASTGTVILPEQQDLLQVVTLSNTRTIATFAKTLRAVMDDTAVTAVYEGQPFGGGKLLARVNLGTGVESGLVRAPDLSLVGMTYDGQLIAFLSDVNLTSAGTGGVEQLFSVRADGSGLRQITQDPAGLVEATLARNGAIAYAVTAAGRLLKIDTASGSATALIGRTLTLETSGSAAGAAPVAGSVYCVNGTGFADSASSAVPPLPPSLGDFQLLLDGTALPLQSVAPEQACFQIPWNTSMDPYTLSAVTNSDPTFQGPSTATFQISYAAFPNFLFLGPQYPLSVTLAPYALASHEDFRGPLTRHDPARPGEIIHLWMTGLGPVAPPVPTGSAAPASPPAAITSSLACQLSAFPGIQATALVLFAGLAPGSAGYYQVDVQLPRNIPVFHGDSIIVCAMGQRSNDASIPVFAQHCPPPGLAGPPGKAPRGCLQNARLPSGVSEPF